MKSSGADGGEKRRTCPTAFYNNFCLGLGIYLGSISEAQTFGPSKEIKLYCGPSSAHILHNYL